MDTSETYIKMSEQAIKQTDIGKKWKSLPQKMRLGTFICFGSVIGMVINTVHEKPINELAYLIPETLAWRRWCDLESEDLKTVETGKNFSDDGFPLIRQDQIQEMIGKIDLAFCIYQAGKKWGGELYRDRDQVFDIEADSPEQIWLAFYMHEKHNLIWNGDRWVKGGLK